jgi:hypothetical protein
MTVAKFMQGAGMFSTRRPGDITKSELGISTRFAWNESILLTVRLRDKVDLNTSKRGNALVNRLLGDSGRDVALGASGSSGSNSRACQSGAGGEELASSDSDNAGERGSRTILDERGKADGTGCDGGGGTHIGYGGSRVFERKKDDMKMSLVFSDD